MRYIFILLSFFWCFGLLAQELSPPTFSLPSGFYSEDVSLEITHLDTDVLILYTTDGSEPIYENIQGEVWFYKTEYPTSANADFYELYEDSISTKIYNSSLILQDRTPVETVLASVSTTLIYPDIGLNGVHRKAHIIRARAYSEIDDKYSDIVSANYFIFPEATSAYSFPVLALSFDNPYLYDYYEGISVPGVDYEDWMTENPTETVDGFTPANYQRRGSGTEKEVHFNYFVNGEEVLNQNAGLRINGGYTRSYPNKSLRIYAKKAYGKKELNYAFFKDYDLNKFQRLVLRNSGNDANYTLFRDAFVHKLSKNLNFDTQESQAIVLFLNGEYNGIRNIRERYDKKYFGAVHQVPEDELDFLENYGEVKEGDANRYNEMISFFETHDLETEEDYQEALKFIEPSNFIDYYLTYIYAANDDWPGNNNLFWRRKVEPGAIEEAHYNDGRFRWILKDMDRAFALKDKYENSHHANTLAWATRNSNSTLLFRKLLQNESFKQMFITRFADVMNTTFKEERVLHILSQFEQAYTLEIEENTNRWFNFAANRTIWERELQYMKDFALNRPNYQREHILEYFDLEATYNLTLNISNTEHGYIHLNTIDILPSTDGVNEGAYPWEGVYFKDVPIQLKAIPNEGYVFSHWSGDIGSLKSEISIRSKENLSVKANFVLASEFIKEEVDIIVYPNPTTDILKVFAQEDLVKYKIYCLNGRKALEGYYRKEINISLLVPGVYVLEVEDVLGKTFKKKILKN